MSRAAGSKHPGPEPPDEESVDLTVPAGWARFQLVALWAGALAVARAAFSFGGHDPPGRLVLLAVAALMAFAGVRLGDVRLALRGSVFQFTGVWRSGEGRADDFIGWDTSNVAGRPQLLRRRDLRWVMLPIVPPSLALEMVTLRWLMKYLPGVDPAPVRRIRRSAAISDSLALHLLKGPLTSGSAPFYMSARDVEVARAARAVAQSRCIRARENLHVVVQALPLPSVTACYVFEALRIVGDASTAALLQRLAPRYTNRHGLGHYVRTLSALATPAEQALLTALLLADDSFARHEARRALVRLGLPNAD